MREGYDGRRQRTTANNSVQQRTTGYEGPQHAITMLELKWMNERDAGAKLMQEQNTIQTLKIRYR